MHAVVRTYSGRGASEVFDAIIRLGDDVKALIGGVPGFVSYTALRDGAGGITVTLCQDKAGTDESSRRAAEFLKERLTSPADPPTITEGDTVLQFDSRDTVLPVA